ncbi:hypothetical protein PYW07_006668 [Mythimna separata]|uniref:RING-type E3 ubiquitin transferase n=1 Tax=Mythimna separata TaxID=271217 RepID=A0AAD8DWP9_MYTSE|nr:hypothetical protein PYW07_006668 [Mythimna separata]
MTRYTHTYIGIYTVTERCRDGWYKGCSERSQRCGVFPGNYVAPAASSRPKHDKTSSAVAAVAGGAAASAAGAPDAPPRARDPAHICAQPLTYPWCSPAQSQQNTPRSEKPKEKAKADKSSISTGVSLMKRLAAMKKCKSPPPAGYSMDNPVFEDGPGTSLMPAFNSQQHHPVHVRSGSCPSQLLRALPPAARAPAHKERVSAALHDHHHLHRAGTENPWQSQHRKSQSLDVTASRRDRHHLQPNKERFRCIVPYPPNSEYELELKVDDIVIVSKKRGDGWYKGTLQRTGRTGLFPASFVQSCPE